MVGRRHERRRLPDVEVRASVGADVPILSTIAWVALGVGALLLLAAGGLVVLGVRKPA